MSPAVEAEQKIEKRGDGQHTKKMAPGYANVYGKWDRMQKSLNLSEPQMRAIDDINLRFKKSYLKRAEKLAPLKMRIERLKLDENPNYGEIETVLKEIAPIKTALQLERMKHKDAIRKTLNPEQRRKFNAISDKRKKRGHRKSGGFFRGRH